MLNFCTFIVLVWKNEGHGRLGKRHIETLELQYALITVDGRLLMMYE